MKCRVCGSTNISIGNDIYGLDRNNNVVGGRYRFTVDAGQGQTWNSTGSRYKSASLLDCYKGGLTQTETDIKKQHGVRMVVKQYGICDRCGFNMNLNDGRQYNVKP